MAKQGEHDYLIFHIKMASQSDFLALVGKFRPHCEVNENQLPEDCYAMHSRF